MSARASYHVEETVEIYDVGFDIVSTDILRFTLTDAVSLYYALKDLPEVAARIAVAEGASA